MPAVRKDKKGNGEDNDGGNRGGQQERAGFNGRHVKRVGCDAGGSSDCGKRGGAVRAEFGH